MIYTSPTVPLVNHCFMTSTTRTNEQVVEQWFTSRTVGELHIIRRYRALTLWDSYGSWNNGSRVVRLARVVLKGICHYRGRISSRTLDNPRKGMTKKEDKKKKIEKDREEEEEDQQQQEQQEEEKEYLRYLGNRKNAFVLEFNIFNICIFPFSGPKPEYACLFRTSQHGVNSKHLSRCKTYQIRRYISMQLFFAKYFFFIHKGFWAAIDGELN